MRHIYTVILEPAEEGGCVVGVPALPEVVTEADSEALAMVEDAIPLVLDSRRERGEPIRVGVNEPLRPKLPVAASAGCLS